MPSSEILSVGDEEKWNFFAFLWLTRDEKGQTRFSGLWN